MWHDMVLCTLTMTFVLWWFYRFGFDFSESHVILIKTFIIQKTFIFIHFLFYPALYVSACVSVCGINNRYYKIWKFNFPFLCILEVVGGAQVFYLFHISKKTVMNQVLPHLHNHEWISSPKMFFPFASYQNDIIIYKLCYL